MSLPFRRVKALAKFILDELNLISLEEAKALGERLGNSDLTLRSYTACRHRRSC